MFVGIVDVDTESASVVCFEYVEINLFIIADEIRLFWLDFDFGFGFYFWWGNQGDLMNFFCLFFSLDEGVEVLAENEFFSAALRCQVVTIEGIVGEWYCYCFVVIMIFWFVVVKQ